MEKTLKKLKTLKKALTLWVCLLLLSKYLSLCLTPSSFAYMVDVLRIRLGFYRNFAEGKCFPLTSFPA